MAGEVGHLVNGRYRLDGLIGRGGMGRVWRGHDANLDRDVAVKELIIPTDLPNEERQGLVERALLEARVAARLRHHSVIDVHDVVLDDGIPWIVMELVAGASLGDEIVRTGGLDWERVARIGAAVADALAHAHTSGIVHRDLKPENVLLSGDRTIIADFGIARVLDATTHLTRTGTAIGTPHFMAPEQLEAAPVSAACDLWSLGATLYAAVEGRRPFDAPTLTALYAAILTKPPVPMAKAGPLASVLERLLCKDPVERPDAAATAELLRCVITDAPENLTHRPTAILELPPTVASGVSLFAPRPASPPPRSEPRPGGVSPSAHQRPAVLTLATCEQGRSIRTARLVPVRWQGQAALAVCLKGSDSTGARWSSVLVHDLANPGVTQEISGVLDSAGALVLTNSTDAFSRLTFLLSAKIHNSEDSRPTIAVADLSGPAPAVRLTAEVRAEPTPYTTGAVTLVGGNPAVVLGGPGITPAVHAPADQRRPLRRSNLPTRLLSGAHGTVIGYSAGTGRNAAGAIVWNGANGQVLHRFGDRRDITHAAVSSSGRHVAFDGTSGVGVYQASTGAQVARLAGADELQGLGIAMLDWQHERTLLSRVTRERLRLWEVTERQLVADLPGIGETVLATTMVAIAGWPAVVLATRYQVAAMILREILASG